MMTVLIDTNIVLDFLLQREPYYHDAARISLLSEKGYISGYISASAVTDIFYIARKETKSKNTARELVGKLLKTIHVASITENSIFEALELNWDDFEDSVQYVAGKNISANYIITRNPKDFSNSKVSVLSPHDFLQIFLENKRL